MTILHPTHRHFLVVAILSVGISLSLGFGSLSPKIQRSNVASQLVLNAHSSSSSTSSSYLATCIPGLSEILADELSEVHSEITDISTSGNAAVTFRATREASLYALCWVRTAHRLLELVAASDTAEIYDRNDLMEFIKQEVNVKDLLGDGKGGLLTISVKAILNNPRLLPQDLSHSHFSALTVKNALCDVVRERRGDRPSVNVESPDVPLVVMLRGTSNGASSIALYRSLHPPGSLHKRGYRTGAAIHKAAMKESLAAGLLREAGWHVKVKEAKDSDMSLRLVDPMAGSGSFLLEATMMAADLAPGLMRIRCEVPDSSLPPVTRWKSEVDSVKIWKTVLLDAKERAKAGLQWMRDNKNQLSIHANDIHPGALKIMESSLSAAGLQSLVQISNLDCYDMGLVTSADNNDNSKYMVVTNPPWGVRLTEDIEDSWEGLRHYLRDTCPSGTEAWVLSGDKSSTKLLKLRRERMIPIQTGDQTLRWIQYTIRSADTDVPTTSSKVTSMKKVEQEDSW